MHDDLSGQPTLARPGFRAFADGRSREPEPAYEGWGQPDPQELNRDRSLSEGRRWSWPAILAAGGLAIITGGAVFVAQSSGLRAAPSAVAEPTESRLQVELAQQDAAPVPYAGGDRLDNLPSQALPPEAGAQAPSSLPQVVAALSPLPQPRAQPQLPPPTSVRRAEGTEAPSAAILGREASSLSPAPQRTQFDCRDAPSRAAALVCSDPKLARLDQQMKRAYSAALEAGVPKVALQDDQADWMDVRDEAARLSRKAVEDIYRQRIAELWQAGEPDY